jgi:Flp pilus assembly protein TadG
MSYSCQRPLRKGAVLVEAAIVLPVLILLLLAIIIGGTGVLFSEQVTAQVREASRWASVRGANFHRTTKQSSPTQNDILQQVVLPMVVNMDPTQLSLSVQWIDVANNVVYDWDSAPKYVKTISASGEYVTSRVRVTIAYNWSPGILLGNSIISSVSEFPMSN